MRGFKRRISTLLLCILLTLSFAGTALAANHFWVNPDNGKTYLVDDNGNIIKSKFFWVGEDLYLFDWKDGAMFTNGWCKADLINSTTQEPPLVWYYFTPDGKAVHNTVFQDPKTPSDWYIFDEYYMNSTSGYRQFEGKTYYCPPEGHGNLLINSWRHEAAGSRYFKSDASMAINETVVLPNGDTATFDSNGYLIN